MKFNILFLTTLFLLFITSKNKAQSFNPVEIWPDNNGVHINAHGGRCAESQYFFLPITITADGKMKIHWHNELDLSFFTPERK